MAVELARCQTLPQTQGRGRHIVSGSAFTGCVPILAGHRDRYRRAAVSFPVQACGRPQCQASGDPSSARRHPTKVTVGETGYVGPVTGACLSEMGKLVM
jgi:hypothetical protein